MGVLPAIVLLPCELVVGWLMGVLLAWSLRVAAGEGTLRGAGEEKPKGVVTWLVAFLEAEVGRVGRDGVGVDMVGV